MIPIQSLAREMSESFEARTRESGQEYDTPPDETPQWMTDVCMAAHGDMLPDDWRYRMIRAAVATLADIDEDDDNDPDDRSAEFADNFVPIYTSDRLAWLASHLGRASYVDEAADEFCASGDGEPFSVIRIIGWGVYVEAREVFDLVVQALTNEAERR